MAQSQIRQADYTDYSNSFNELDFVIRQRISNINTAIVVKVVKVKTDTTTDPNSRGGKGSVLTFTVTFQEDDSNVFQEPVDGTLTSSITKRVPNTTYLNNLPFTITFANSAGVGTFTTAS